MEEKDIKQIEAYLEGSLEGDELERFKQRLESEEDLAKELALYQEVDLRLEAIQKEELKTEWKKYLDENTPLQSASKKLRPIYYSIGIAASFLMLFGVYWWFLKPTPPTLLASNYWDQTATFVYTDVDRSQVLSSEESKKLEAAYTKFESKEYQESLTILHAFPSANDEILLLKGACYFQIEDYQNAQNSFQTILHGAYISKDEASWYLALTLLKLEEIENAKSLLGEIIENQSWNHTQARELFDEL